MNARGPSLAAGVVLACCGTLFAGAVTLMLLGSQPSGLGSVAWLIVQIAFAVVGGLIGLKRPDNNVGWVLLGGSLLTLVQSAAWHYANLAFGEASRDLPGAAGVAWLAGWTAVPGFVVFMFFLPLLFPDGRLLSPRWRPLAMTVGALAAITAVALAVRPGSIEDLPVDNPLGVASAADLIEVVYLWGFPLVGVSGLIASSSLIVRFRRSSGIERQQLKLFGAATLLFLSFTVVTGLGDALSLLEFSLVFEVGGVITLLLMPLSIAVAILRYRLYEIDRIISRTLAYGALSAVLAGGYLLVVLALQSVLPVDDDSPLIVAISTLGVVAAFGPLRGRVQEVVDRRFNRSRYDAERTLAAFNGRLRSEVELDSLTRDLVGVVKDTMQPAYVSLWLAHRGAER